MAQIQDLVDGGHTVVMVEHEIRVVAACDWLIDLGPGAGHEGGRIVATGTPHEVARAGQGATARFLPTR